MSFALEDPPGAQEGSDGVSVIHNWRRLMRSELPPKVLRGINSQNHFDFAVISKAVTEFKN